MFGANTKAELRGDYSHARADFTINQDMRLDFCGHVPMLFHPVFADYVQLYGKRGLEAAGENALPLLARLYWYTVEFGLIDTDEGLRTFGAGIISSAGETPFSLVSTEP